MVNGPGLKVLKDFNFSVMVLTDSEEHAIQALAERLGPDEDYGFEYYIEDWFIERKS